jgi:chromosome segregation ATPase
VSDNKVSLDFLGEQMLRMQADLRGVRSEQLQMRAEQVKLESEQAGMRADVRDLRSNLGELDTKVERLDMKTDAHHAANQAQFEQVRQTMTTNLEITLQAIRSVDKKIT